MNLHSVRFSSHIVRFFTLLLLLEKVSAFHLHFYRSIIALSRLPYIGKNFFFKFSLRTTRAIFQTGAVPLYKNFFSENFCPVCDCQVSADMDLQKCGWIAHTFSRSKNVKKWTKTVEKQILCKFTSKGSWKAFRFRPVTKQNYSSISTTVAMCTNEAYAKIAD